MSEVAGGKRPAPVETEEGSGPAKKQRPDEGGAAAKPNQGGIKLQEKSPQQEEKTKGGGMSAETGAAGEKRPLPVEPGEGSGAAKKQKRDEAGLAEKPENQDPPPPPPLSAPPPAAAPPTSLEAHREGAEGRNSQSHATKLNLL